jgi:hypothetical protein
MRVAKAKVLDGMPKLKLWTPCLPKFWKDLYFFVKPNLGGFSNPIRKNINES